jgi:hypothetical protein
MKYATPSALLADLDSHGIYGVGILDECDFDTSSIPRFTAEQARAGIEARGLGGWIDPDLGECIYGWRTAEALASAFLDGAKPGAFLSGRGSVYRCCVEALKAAGR